MGLLVFLAVSLRCTFGIHRWMQFCTGEHAALIERCERCGAKRGRA